MILFPHEFVQLKQYIDMVSLDIERMYKVGVSNEDIESIEVMDYYRETRTVYTTVTIKGINMLPEGVGLNADSVTNYARVKANEKSLKLSYVLDFDEYLK